MFFESGPGSWVFGLGSLVFDFCTLPFDLRLEHAGYLEEQSTSSKYKTQRPKSKDLSQQKMQRGFAKPNLVPAVQDSWLARREPDGIVNHGAVD